MRARIEKKKPTLTLEDAAREIERGKDVILLFSSATMRRRFQQRVYQTLVSRLGTPKDKEAIAAGSYQERTVRWPNGASVILGLKEPPITKATVGQVVLPPDWK
jgi:hypothetical protein